MTISKGVQAVVQGHHDDIAVRRKNAAVEARRATRTKRVRAAMHPHHHRARATIVERRRIEVEDKTVFASRD